MKKEGVNRFADRRIHGSAVNFALESGLFLVSTEPFGLRILSYGRSDHRFLVRVPDLKSGGRGFKFH